MSEVAIEESRGPSTKTHVCSKCNSRKPVFKASDGIWERWECPKCGHVDYVRINKRNPLYSRVRFTHASGAPWHPQSPVFGIDSATATEEAPQQEVPSSLRDVFFGGIPPTAPGLVGNRTPATDTFPAEPTRAAPSWHASSASAPVEILLRWVNEAVTQ